MEPYTPSTTPFSLLSAGEGNNSCAPDHSSCRCGWGRGSRTSVIRSRGAGRAARAGRGAGFVAARPGLDPADVGWSLAATRSVFEHRAVITGTGREELAAGLAAVAAGQPAAGVVSGVAPAGG